jgi:hypothetical protein
MTELIVLLTFAIAIGVSVAGLIGLNRRVKLQDTKLEGSSRVYTSSVQGPMKTYVTAVGFFFAAILVLLVIFAILIALTPGRLE